MMPIIPSLSKVPCFYPQHRHKQLKHKDWDVFHPQHLSSVLRFQIRSNPPNHCDVAMWRCGGVADEGWRYLAKAAENALFGQFHDLWNESGKPVFVLSRFNDHQITKEKIEKSQ